MQVTLVPQTSEQWTEAMAFMKKVHEDNAAARAREADAKHAAITAIGSMLVSAFVDSTRRERGKPEEPPRGEPVETPGPGSRANPHQRDAEPPQQERRFNTSL